MGLSGFDARGSVPMNATCWAGAWLSAVRMSTPFAVHLVFQDPEANWLFVPTANSGAHAIP